VSGFLRYIQHRDLHPGSAPEHDKSQVAGLLKYVAYRDRASTRAELFGPEGKAGTRERKEFADFVARSIQDSRPQVFRARDGRLMDRRRSVSRFVISPERADGLDLERLMRAAVARLESELGVTGVRWLAAIHRNTAHHHVHFVLAGMYLDAAGRYRRLDVSRQRLAAMKEALVLEIERQREARQPSRILVPSALQESAAAPLTTPSRPVISRQPMVVTRFKAGIAPPSRRRSHRQSPTYGSASALFRVRTAARRYAQQMERDAAADAWRRGWEFAA
jgi:hypothetical protein